MSPASCSSTSPGKGLAAGPVRRAGTFAYSTNRGPVIPREYHPRPSPGNPRAHRDRPRTANSIRRPTDPTKACRVAPRQHLVPSLVPGRSGAARRRPPPGEAGQQRTLPLPLPLPGSRDLAPTAELLRPRPARTRQTAPCRASEIPDTTSPGGCAPTVPAGQRPGRPPANGCCPRSEAVVLQAPLGRSRRRQRGSIRLNHRQPHRQAPSTRRGLRGGSRRASACSRSQKVAASEPRRHRPRVRSTPHAVAAPSRRVARGPTARNF